MFISLSREALIKYSTVLRCFSTVHYSVFDLLVWLGLQLKCIIKYLQDSFIQIWDLFPMSKNLRMQIVFNNHLIYIQQNRAESFSKHFKAYNMNKRADKQWLTREAIQLPIRVAEENFEIILNLDVISLLVKY